LLERFGWLLPAVLALSLPVLFDPRASDGFVLPRIGLLIAGAGVAAVAGLWSRSGRLGPLAAPAAALATAALLACVFSVSVPVSIIGAYQRYDDVVVRLAYLGAFAASAWFLPTKAQRRRVVSLFILAGCTIAVEALWQSFSRLMDRPDANLGQSNLLGVLVAMAIPLCLNRGRSDRRWFAPVLLLGAALVASGSRAAWLGTVTGSGALVVLLAPRRRRPLAAGAAAVALGIALAVVLATPLRNLDRDTGSARLHVWSDSVALIAARPITGWGEDTFGLVYGRFQRGDWEPGAAFDRAHSEPLDLLASQGVLGLLAALWFWGVFWITLLKRIGVEEAAAIGAAWVVYATWAMLNFDWAPATGLLWLVSGVAWATVRQPPEEPTRARRLPVWAAVTLTSVVCAVVVARSLLPPIADRYEFAGDHATAARLDPLQAYYHEQVGIAAIDAGDLATAEAQLSMAWTLGEDDAGSYVELGNVETALGKGAAARKAYQRAVQIAPYYTEARQHL
jgi:O-antigen ligase